MSLSSSATSSSKGDYVYTPLEKDHIRILELEPGSFEDEIRCRLKHVGLTEAANVYQALSYAWGNPHNLSRIKCSGYPKDVTKSLCAALKHLRDKNEVLWLWADALCINQGDDLEKSVQVRIMGKIYAHAKRVVVWLGEETPEVKGALGNLKEWLQFQAPPGIDWVSANIKWPTSAFFSFDRKRLSNDAEDYLQFQQKVLPPILHLFARSWWGRKWIIQELVQAKDATLICGHSRLSWNSLLAADRMQWRALNNHFNRIAPLLSISSHQRQDNGQTLAENVQNGMNNAAVLSRLCATFKAPDSEEAWVLRVYGIIYYTTGFKCFDPRDNLFSLSSIIVGVDPSHAELLRIDYRDSVAAVAARLTEYLIHTSPRTPLNHFAYVLGTRQELVDGKEVKTEDNKFSELTPSWACSYLDARFADRTDLSWPISRLNLAAGSPFSGRQTKWKLCSERRVLSVWGAFVGEITELLTPPVPNPTFREYSSWGRTIWNSIEKISSSDNHGETSLAFFYNIMTCGGAKSNALQRDWEGPTLDGAAAWIRGVLDPDFGHPNRSFLSADSEAWKFDASLSNSRHCKLGTTSTGHLGWFPQTAEVGDKICVFPGENVLHLVAPCGKGYHNLIGACYVQELMYGKALQMGLEEIWIDLY